MPAPFDRRAVFAWCFFDWANSAFPAVITTFVFATYFTQAVASDPISGTTQWGHAIAVAGFIIAVISPVLGSVADLTGRRKIWLAVFAALNVLAVGALFADENEIYDLTNIGTLSAFAIVCIGVLVLRHLEPDRPRPFRVPFVWPVTLVGAAAC